MAFPTVVGAGTLASGTGDISPGLPSGWAVDDIHWLFVATANESVTTPAGWTQDANSPQGTGTAGGSSAVGLAVFWRRAEAGDTAPTVTDPGNHCAARILGIRGCPTSGSPVDASSGDVEATAIDTCTFSGVTTASADTLLIHVCARATQASGAYTFTPSNGSLASFSERFKNAWADGNGGTFSVWTATKATAGATGDSTGTWFRPAFDMSDFQALMLIAVKPANTVSATLSTAASVTASLTTAIRMGASLTGSATVTPVLTTAIRCAATLSGSAAVTSSLTTGIKLNTSLSAAAGVTASLTTAIRCNATLTGTATVTPVLTTAIRCVATMTGTAAVTSTLTTGIQLNVSLSASSSVTASLTTAIRLNTTLTGSATIVASLATSYGIVDVTLDDAILTATAFDQTGQVYVTLDSAVLEAGGYLQSRSGTLSITLEDVLTDISGIQLATRVGSLNVTLDAAILAASGDARNLGSGSIVVQLDSAGVISYGFRVVASTGSVSVTLGDATLETLAGHGAVGAVLSTDGGRLEDATLSATGRVGNNGQLTATLEDAQLTADGRMVVMEAAYARGGLNPGILAYGSGGLVWGTPASKWQSLCSIGLVAQFDNPSGIPSICVTPIDLP